MTDQAQVEKARAAHTPGRWEARGNGIYADASRTFVAETSSCETGTGFHYDDQSAIPLAECEANAHLIAAAPAMLSALEAVVEVFREYGPVDPSVDALISAAIAAAKGETA